MIAGFMGDLLLEHCARSRSEVKPHRDAGTPFPGAGDAVGTARIRSLLAAVTPRHA
jgi:hypothetical protein